MRHQKLSLPALLALLLLVLVPASGSAQEDSTFSVGLMAGFGTAADSEPDTGFGNLGFQAFFTMALDVRTLFVARVGQMSFEAEDFDLEADLIYLTLAGEYVLTTGFYESGLFLGLGFYDLNGDGFFIDDDSAIGLTLGTTGTFRLSDRLNLVLEVSGHYADLDNNQFFLMAHGGIAYRF